MKIQQNVDNPIPIQQQPVPLNNDITANKMSQPVIRPIPQCDYCRHGTPTAGELHQFTFHQGPEVGPRDTDCSMCFAPFLDGDGLVQHNMCQRRFHRQCMEDWIHHSIERQDEDGPVTCPMCRVPVYCANVPDLPHVEILLQQDNHDGSDSDSDGINSMLVDYMRQNVPVLFMPRSHMRDEIIPRLDSDQQLWWRIQTHRSRRTGEFPRTPVPSYRYPGMDIMFGAPYIYAGAFRIIFCPHRETIVLFSSEEMFMELQRLYVAGWNPVGGLSGARGETHPTTDLHTLIEQAITGREDVETTLPAVEIASTCRQNRGIRAGQRILMTLECTNSRWSADVWGYSVRNATGDTVTMEVNDTRSLVEELGVPDWLHINYHPGYVNQIVRIHNRAYWELIEPLDERHL